jgi:4-hydroxy-4-methyl-2-oxoglutarate aldolase
MGVTVGVAATCVFGRPDPNYPGRPSFMDVVDALDAMPRPTILIQQKLPAELMTRASPFGESMVRSMKAVGRTGMLSNGPSRDVDAIRRLEIPDTVGRRHCRPWQNGSHAVDVPVSSAAWTSPGLI